MSYDFSQNVGHQTTKLTYISSNYKTHKLINRKSHKSFKVKFLYSCCIKYELTTRTSNTQQHKIGNLNYKICDAYYIHTWCTTIRVL